MNDEKESLPDGIGYHLKKPGSRQKACSCNVFVGMIYPIGFCTEFTFKQIGLLCVYYQQLS